MNFISITLKENTMKYNVNLLFTDSDRQVYKIKANDVYEGFYEF